MKLKKVERRGKVVVRKWFHVEIKHTDLQDEPYGE